MLFKQCDSEITDCLVENYLQVLVNLKCFNMYVKDDEIVNFPLLLKLIFIHISSANNFLDIRNGK